MRFQGSIQRTSNKWPINDFLGKVPTRQSPNNAVLVHGATYINIAPGGIWDDPSDSSRVIFSMGEFTGFTTVGCRIGYYLIDKSDPYTFSARQGTLLAGTPATDDENGCRFGCVVIHEGNIHYFYVGISPTFEWRIFRATSTDGINFTKQGLVLDFDGVVEFSVSDPSIVYDEVSGKWWMAYSSWDGVGTPANNNPGSSKVGIRLAWSTDLINWTKTGTTVLPLGTSGAIDDNNIEGAQLLMIGSKKVLLYTCNDGSIWSIGLATGDSWETVFIKKPTAWFSRSPTGGDWDDALVAVALVHSFPSGDVMYYQGFAGGSEELDIGAADLI